jgi:hypothetical protein
MRIRCSRLAVSGLGLAFLGAAFICPPPAAAAARLHCPDLALFYKYGGPHVPTGQMMAGLRGLANAQTSTWSNEEKSACYKELADDYRDSGSYRAEPLYLRAVELSPAHPRVHEALARYYRTFRGYKSLFAESEEAYLEAEQAIEDALELLPSQGASDRRELLELREAIIRGRIELNKREGLGLLIPREPGQKLGAYLSSQLDVGRNSVLYKYLATDARKLLNGTPPNTDIDQLLRTPRYIDTSHRLRVRHGSLPYLDVRWHFVDVTDAIVDTGAAIEWRVFPESDLEIQELEFAVEDTAGILPVGDILWRIDYRRVTATEEDKDDEKADRVTAATTLTRSFGRIKADLELLGSYSWVDRSWGTEDEENMVAAGLRVLRFPDLATTERWTVDPRAQEFRLGFVRQSQDYDDAGDQDEDGVLDERVVYNTVYGGIKLAELLPRTDVELLANWFETDTRGRPGEDNGSVELNLILTHRILDWVNRIQIGQVDKPVGLAQWAASLRYFEEISTHALDDFENRGGVLSSWLELYSGPLNRSTVILEASYGVRHYHRLDEVQHLFNVGFRLGF